jgi:hypothetical protein
MENFWVFGIAFMRKYYTQFDYGEKGLRFSCAEHHGSIEKGSSEKGSCALL